VSDDLKAYLDGELSPWRRFLLGRRLAQSPELRAELDGLQRLSADLAALRPAPDTLSETLRSRLLATAPVAPVARPARATRSLALGLAGSAALATVALFVLRPSAREPREAAKSRSMPAPASESSSATASVGAMSDKAALQQESKRAYFGARASAPAEPALMKGNRDNASDAELPRRSLSPVRVVVTIPTAPGRASALRSEIDRRVRRAGGRRMGDHSLDFTVPSTRLQPLATELRALSGPSGARSRSSLRVRLISAD
jgi:hypothetical protein